ncbi:hypothetical protein JBL43_06615 [Aureibaculum sp. A20]|uniref:Lipoprotein n=1 Tax=Aureibaculum flavum TaxID=2795986 RepID=A0ABS0WPK3_9FLAO|nr:hypothetical protein [Aureibaculum flavum]MBJ2173905.1 hypothetical protein [Aureibaculum flavum]
MYRFSLFCIVFLFLLQGCIKQNSINETIIRKEYGRKILNNDSTYIEIDLKKYPTYLRLHNRMQELACSDSTPKISFRSDNILKTVYFPGSCQNMPIYLREKNVIEITQDSVFKSINVLSIDSLYYIMKMDYFNNGEDPSLSDSHDRVRIRIQYDKDERTNELTQLLDKITKYFDSVKVKTSLNISLFEKLINAPPPPPPIDLNEIE